MTKTRSKQWNVKSKAAAFFTFVSWLWLQSETFVFAQVVGGSARTLANPLRVEQFFDSAAFFLIKTVGMVVGIIALAISIFAAKFGRGSFGNIASVCFYIALLFLAPSIVQLLSLFAGIGFF